MKQLTNDEAKAVSLEILSFIDRICRKLNLKYSLAWGTLIGAVRHHGLIPWDDDIDVIMPRKDYMKFISYMCENEGTLSPFNLVSIYNRNDYFYLVSRVVNNETMTIPEKKSIQKQKNFGLFVDIYPLDYCGNTYEQATKFFEKQMRVETLRYMALSDTFQKAKTSVFRTIIKYPLFMYSKAMGAGSFLRKLEKNINKINENDTQYCCSWCGTGGMPATKLVFPSEWFNELMEVQFEDQYYFIPKHYDEILSQVYGDYMSFPPIEEQVGHHYYVAYRK